ncbi:MAG: hypothetical protein CTY15_12670 [Methylocystis sp.]|nr:MAG: hypothetical protein CTY15_12670 [Methylocystis sp.]
MNGLFWRRFVACVVVIATGLALRRWSLEHGAPFFVWKYGGSLLWGAMVFFIAALLLPRLPRGRIAAVAAAIAVAVEFSRLYHTPWLDDFRVTTAGALLLGRHFSLWNVAAYLAGVGFGAALDALLERRGPTKPLQP